MQRRLLVVYTDGESAKISPLFKLTLQRRVTPVFVHVWEPGERIYNHGKPDPRYIADPASAAALDDRREDHRRVAPSRERDAAQSRAQPVTQSAAPGRARTSTRMRVSRSPRGSCSAASLPLGFLLWRRNAT